MKIKKFTSLNDFKKTKESSFKKTYENIDNEYLKARHNIGIANSSSTGKIMVYGSRALSLLNHSSTTQIENITTNNTYTILMKKKKFIGEVLILKISPLRYLVVTSDFERVFKYLKSIKKKYPLVTIDDATDRYSLFTFHGEKANDYFNKFSSTNLYKTKQQNYTYYQMLLAKKDEKTSFDYFINLNFIPISIETKALFMYNNGVVTNLKNIYKPYRLSIYKILYPFNNYPYYSKEKLIAVRQYEIQKNVLVFKNNKIYNHRKKRVGIIHCSYKIPNKKNPYVIAFVKRYQTGRLAIIKKDKQEILIKQFINYQE